MSFGHGANFQFGHSAKFYHPPSLSAGLSPSGTPSGLQAVVSAILVRNPKKFGAPPFCLISEMICTYLA